MLYRNTLILLFMACVSLLRANNIEVSNIVLTDVYQAKILLVGGR